MFSNKNNKKPSMGNHYKPISYLGIALFLLVGIIYSLPNFWGKDPSIEISNTKTRNISSDDQTQVESVLSDNNIKIKEIKIDRLAQPQKLYVKFYNTDDQLRAQDLVRSSLNNLDDITNTEDEEYAVALNLIPATPGWLVALQAAPMYLGLDLQGGVYFLMEVDVDAAVDKNYQSYVDILKLDLRNENLRYQNINFDEGTKEILLTMGSTADLTRAIGLINRSYPNEFIFNSQTTDLAFSTKLQFTQTKLFELQRYITTQNITTLRNRIDELGVSEPVVQQQGLYNIAVQLPGIQDTTRAKQIIGSTATLEFRMVEDRDNANQVKRLGYSAYGGILYQKRDDSPIVLKRDVVVNGDNIVNASASIDTQSGGPMVSVSLDGEGGDRMLENTKININKDMAVVFIENKTDTYLDRATNKKKTRKYVSKKVINVATIRGQFANRFQITGLSSMDEANDLSLLLRAGALAAPMDIVQESTIGPSFGKDNIDKGFLSIIIGFLAVLIFMFIRYKIFGLFANLALLSNLFLIVAALSLLQATLTLPGIAGIVLTVGMAVDANVLIFERIKEEMAGKVKVQEAINIGYKKALATIADANITTLIAAVILFAFGTGAIKGFAVTLSLGIASSMFTAIIGSRALVNLVYGRKHKLDKISI